MQWASHDCYNSTAEYLPTRRHAGCHEPARTLYDFLDGLLSAWPSWVRPYSSSALMLPGSYEACNGLQGKACRTSVVSMLV